MEEIQTVTIYRSWVQIAAVLKSDAERGRLYHAICEYSLHGKEPELEGSLAAFFTLMKPSIDKSNKRKNAQQKSTQKRLQNSLQNDLQKGSQKNLQSTSQNDCTRVRKTGTETEKKDVTLVTSKEKKSFSNLLEDHLLPSVKEKKSFSILLPDHLQTSVMDAKWKEWEDYRRKKGKPISEAAARQQMKMLSDLTQEQAIEAINNSIANDYQGLFRPVRLYPRKNNIPAPGEKDYTGI